MSDLAVGQTVRLPDGRTGIVRFVGNTHFASGDWVGVELEDDSGKNDGSVQGERYFDCSMGHGMFVRPTTLVITAQAPAAAAKPARRPSRPSSFNPGAGRTASDTGLTKRMSLNAPSPSPGPKAPRPPSILRPGEGTARRWSIPHLHGPSSNACIQNYPAALDIFSTDKTDTGETYKRSTFHDWSGDDLCQKAICRLGRREECSGQRR
ncbi:CAP-Gly domain-containing protein [Colletotrichum tofieldiae]|nr:CAP-Gly domain-containing protein [Colletotrichum tofieldiae]